MQALTTLIQNNTRSFSPSNKKENKMHINLKVRYKTFPFVDDDFLQRKIPRNLQKHS